jgi:hypothetical protein
VFVRRGRGCACGCRVLGDCGGVHCVWFEGCCRGGGDVWAGTWVGWDKLCICTFLWQFCVYTLRTRLCNCATHPLALVSCTTCYKLSCSAVATPTGQGDWTSTSMHTWPTNLLICTAVHLCCRLAAVSAGQGGRAHSREQWHHSFPGPLHSRLWLGRRRQPAVSLQGEGGSNSSSRARRSSSSTN